MDKPIVSVIIPTYNRYEYLLRAIESVYNQTYKNIEVIIINDGSTNKEYKELASLKSGVTVINLPKNQKEIHGFGPGNIRNFGLEKSNGKYIAFLDDDDYWLESKLEIQIDILEGDEYKISSSEAFIGEGPYNSNQNYKKFLQAPDQLLT